MNLLIFHPRLADKIASLIAGEFPTIQINKISDTKAVLPDLSQVDVMIAANDVTENMFTKMPQLKWLHLTSTGHNQVKKGKPNPDLRVTNAGSIPAIAVAEFVFMEILTDVKGFSTLLRQAETKTWKYPQADLIQNKNLTIVGTGHIGLALASRANAFGMSIIGVNSTGQKKENFDQVFPPQEIAAACRKADYLVVAVPESKKTINLISRSVLSQLKPECCIINVSRSHVIDQTYLRELLEENKIRSAYLDTFEQEPLPSNDPLWITKNLVVTPHCAFLSKEHEIQTLKLITQNISRFLKGEDLLNRCYPELE